MSRHYDQIRINKVANGFIVKVACQTFVFMGWDDLKSELDAWYRGETTEFIKKYEESYDTQPRAEGTGRGPMTEIAEGDSKETSD